jgi:hypothetical protein
MLDMTRSFATPLPLPLSHRPPSGFLHAEHPLCVAVVGGRSGGAVLLIGNKRCCFPPIFLPSQCFGEDHIGRVEDTLTLKADIFVFVLYGWKHPRPLD